MNTRKHWLSHFFAFFFVLCMTLGLTVYADEDMKVHFLNVGQADSTLITCGEHAMLIDAGNLNEYPDFHRLLAKSKSLGKQLVIMNRQNGDTSV